MTSEAASTMILIAHSRYRMIARGAVFSSEETSRKVARRIALTWLANALLYGPIQFIDKFTGVSITGFHECKTEFFQIAWVGNLYVVLNNVLPPLAVLALYGAIFMALRNRRQAKPNQNQIS